MGDYAPPQKAGAQFKVCCPFHQERSPSCYIYPDQQTYHCFGCGAHGDIITLVREQEGLDFVDAVEFLARRANIEVVYEERGPSSQKRGPSRSEREALLALMKFTTEFYQRNLFYEDSAEEARSYLKGRGIDRDLCQRFGLGFAPGRGMLSQAARQQGFTPQQLIAANLAVDRDGRLGDRFYGRIMFPICDRFGQTLAYSGRVLPSVEQKAKADGRSVGKYINSSDTPLYSKSDVVWNLHQARSAARKERRLIIMEGPTDVMAAAKHGIEACVAVLGTALTPQHARQMANVVGNEGQVVLLFDGDSAGQNNAVKAVTTFLSCGLSCRVAVMEAGHDPAELLAAKGRPGLDGILARDRSDIDHMLRTLAPLPHGMQPHERIAVIDKILAALRPIADEDVRASYIDEVATWFKIEVSRLLRRLRDGGDNLETAKKQSQQQAQGPETTQEDVVLHILVKWPDLRPLAFDELQMEPHLLPEPWDRLISLLIADPDLLPSDLLNQDMVRGSQQLTSAVHRWLRDDMGRGQLSLESPADLLRDLVMFLRKRGIEADLSRLDAEREQAQREGDMAKRCGFFRNGEISRRNNGPWVRRQNPPCSGYFWPAAGRFVLTQSSFGCNISAILNISLCPKAFS